MKKINTLLFGLVVLIAISGISVYYFLSQDLKYEIEPAEFMCLSLEDGFFTTFETLPNHIFGIGLSYAGHINETASSFVPNIDPPIFKKAISSITYDDSKVIIPSHEDLIKAIESIEPGIEPLIQDVIYPLPALLDYEVELGFVLLEEIDPNVLSDMEYIPKVGFFIANDLSARSVMILGEGQRNRYEYWGIGKSFPGFTAVSQNVWIPNEFKADGIPCITLKCELNQELRQSQNTNDMIYTPKQMLQAIHRKYPNLPLRSGDWVLTGTPGGVIMSTPLWLVRLANMLRLNRFQKLHHKTGKDDISKFITAGDKVVVTGEGLGKVSVEFESN